MEERWIWAEGHPVAEKTAISMIEAIQAHHEADDAEIARLRAMSVRERSRLIESACETAAVIYRSRLAAGLPRVEPAPWPESTWEFLREHSARVRS